jgi:soluble lytic murein transglycosylase-like protein
MGCTAILLLAASSRAAPSGIYAYDAADGTVHLSNIPDDDRYAPLILEKVDPPAGQLAPSLPAPAAAAGMADTLKLIDQAARDHRVDAALLQAVVTVESGYDPRAVSSKGAVGLMQLMPDTASRYGIADLYDPVQNLEAGARHLKYLSERFNCDLALVLAAYNAGEGAVKRHGNNIPPFRETAAYVPKVMRLYERLRNSAVPASFGVSPRSVYSLCPMGDTRFVANL